MSIRIAASRYCSSITRASRPCGGNNAVAINRCTRYRYRGQSSTTTTTTTKNASSSAPKPRAPDVATTTTTTSTAAKETASSTASEGVPIGSTLAACALAIATVSAGAAIAENATADAVPRFDPKEQRFDQSTFVGRFSKMILACDPSLLIQGGEEVMRCKKMVDECEYHLRNLPQGVSETEMSRKLWEAQVT